VEYNGSLILDSFAEAFPMSGTGLVVTAANERWLQHAVTAACGYACSVIGCDAEAGVDTWLDPAQTPDGRPGVRILFFAFNRDALEKAVVNRVGQTILTCATTACYAAEPPGEKSIRLGAQLRYFGDGWQISKVHGERRFWRIPTMDGEFLVEDRLGTFKGVAGGNLILMGKTASATLAAAEDAVAAAQAIPGVILPFPGGVVRSGSKVGSRYRTLRASTNEAYCPSLRGVVRSEVPSGAQAVYELVMDGISADAVAAAMHAGIHAAARPDILAITAGNYGGKLGPVHLHLQDLLRLKAAPI